MRIRHLARDIDLYLDSDGVVVDFDLHCLNIFGRCASDFSHKGSFWAAVTRHDAEVQKFFRHMPKCDGADLLVDFGLQHFRSTSILTAAGNTPRDAPEQKIEWYAHEYPGVKCIVVTKSPDKAVHASPTAILVDDRAKSIDPWVAAGGIGILHTSVENTIAQLSEYLV